MFRLDALSSQAVSTKYKEDLYKSLCITHIN
jgi:hypothetical protein